MLSAFANLAHNPTFWSALLGWLTAQLVKMLCHFVVRREISLQYLISTGGMPSAHSATVTGLATSVAWRCGCDSPLFAVSLAFAILTMFDASTVRRAAGLQARLLNELIDRYFREHRFSETKLKELLGHTRLEVFMGMVIGFLVAVIIQSMWVART